MQKGDNKIKKIWAIILTLLLLLIPIAFLFNIINDRQNYRSEAVDFVAASWASTQILSAPEMFFTVKEGKDNQLVNKFLTLDNYNADVIISTEIRKKGIFEIPVYTADVTLSGDFLNNYGNLSSKEIITKFSVKDSTGFVTEPVFKINNTEPKVSHTTEYKTNIDSEVTSIPFEIKYTIRGLNELFVVPAGLNNNIQISGNWSNPSFEGNFLPTERNIDNEEFYARWSIPGIATSNIDSAKLGVSLLVPVDNYRMTERILKYAFLFLALTFLSYFIFEITSKEENKIHPVQYALLGGAMLIFYMLLVSLSEFIPFFGAYILSADLIITLVFAYTYFVITKKQGLKFSVLISAIMILLYTFLYVLLSLMDFALLIGSIGLFAVIAAVMYITRNVDWYNK